MLRIIGNYPYEQPFSPPETGCKYGATAVAPRSARRRAIRQPQRTPDGSAPDAIFPVIAATLRSTAADIELAKVEQIGSLATAIFERIAAVDGDARGIFSNDAAADYSRAVGRDVRVEEIQPVVNDLLDANVIMRRGHGLYGIADPFVQEIWREKKRLET